MSTPAVASIDRWLIRPRVLRYRLRLLVCICTAGSVRCSVTKYFCTIAAILTAGSVSQINGGRGTHTISPE